MGRRRGNDHVTERAVIAAVRVEQVPVLRALEDFGDAATELHRQVVEQGASDGAHARRAYPADLLIGGRRQLARLEVIQLRLPLLGPAVALPALHFVDEAPVAGGEVLRAHVQRAGVAALAGHAATAAAAFIEKFYCVPGVL